jgi:hypothetical protein
MERKNSEVDFRMKSATIKKRCKCGRTLIVARPENGSAPTPECGCCRKYGLKYSKAEFLNLHKKSGKVVYG